MSMALITSPDNVKGRLTFRKENDILIHNNHLDAHAIPCVSLEMSARCLESDVLSNAGQEAEGRYIYLSGVGA